MPFEAEAKRRALEALLLAGSLQVGLLKQDEEETDASYQRQDVTMRQAVDGRFENANEVRFPAWAAESVISGFAFYGEDGKRLAWESFEQPRPVKRRERLFFDPGAIIVRLED